MGIRITPYVTKRYELTCDECLGKSDYASYEQATRMEEKHRNSRAHKQIMAARSRSAKTEVA